MAIYEKCPHDELTIIMRRYMMQIAEHLAKESGCLALVTGESIGQVASQTMQSLYGDQRGLRDAGVPSAVSVWTSRISWNISERIGTYETSILPYEDCCTDLCGEASGDKAAA